MDYKKANMAARYEHEIPEGYEARIDGNKIIIELKESEDERIRKWLIAVIEEVKTDDDWCADLNKCDEAIAWLKKQKYEYEVFEPVKSTLEYKMGFKAGVESVKQKEQKPADLSELMVHKEPYIAPVPTPIVTDEPKPTEWSEEDLKWAEEIRLALLHYSNDKPFVEKLTNWFDNHIQLKQEWSKEDEKMRQAILQDLANIYAAFPKVNVQPEFDWLKSLRPQPHWKPSEEQINSLWTCLHVTFPNKNVMKIVESLYYDLKNLLS